VVGVRRKQRSNLLILEECVEEPHLVEVRLRTLIPHARVESHKAANEVNFPQRRLREHHEAGADPGHEATRPQVVGAVEARADLVDVVGGAETPLEVVVAEDVVRKLERVGVAVRLDGLIVRGVVHGVGVVIEMVITLGGLVPQVVVGGIGILAERPGGSGGQHPLHRQKSENLTELQNLQAPKCWCSASFLIII